MKFHLFPILAALAFTSCQNNDQDYDATGVFESTEVIVSAQTQGELTMMNPVEGDRVTAGQEIARTDTVQPALKRRQLLAGMNAISSRHYDVSRQVASIRQQIATQQREKDRFARLVKEGAANQKTVDDIDAQIRVLEKQLAAQTETLEKNNSSLGNEAESMEAQIAQIDDQLNRSHVKSPLNGTILAKYAEAGELATPGKPLFKIADTDNLYLRAYITAPQLTTLKIGQAVTVYADMDKDGRKAYKGRITWISDQAEFTPKTIQTRDERANLVYAVKIAVKNDGLIKIGMYGECKL